MNPLKDILEAKEISVRDFAIVVGVGTPEIYHLLSGRGVRLPDSVLSVLKTLGYDPDEIQNEYITWRRSKAQKILAKIGG